MGKVQAGYVRNLVKRILKLEDGEGSLIKKEAVSPIDVI